MAKVGRPSKYSDDTIDKAKILYSRGFIDAEVAQILDVSETTLNNWKLQHPEFLEAIKPIKDEANEKVKASLFQRACGYSHEAVKIFNHDGFPLVVPYTEHYPPDTAAAFIWLKNRDPENWCDRVEHTGKDGTALIPVLNLGKASTD